MSALGAVLAAVAVTGLCLAVAPRSRIVRQLELLAPGAGSWRRQIGEVVSSDLDTAGRSLTVEQLAALKVACGTAAALVVAIAGLALSIGPAPVLIAAYLGWLAPSLVVAERARVSRRQAARASIVLVERLGALVAAGRPPEAALASLLSRPTGSWLLDRTAARVSAAYLLGAPLFRTLGSIARDAGLKTCAGLADDLEHARDLGTGSTAILRERRAALRRRERAAALEAASTVEGKLMLVLTLCYLPALLLLVVVPLFLSLMRGLGA